MRAFVFVVLGLVSTVLAQQSPFGFNPVVTIPALGKVRGNGESKTLNTKRFYASFLGIPFAEPMTNERRFLPPEPKAPWGNDTILEAISSAPPCPQPSHLPNRGPIGGSEENCLALDVYTPELPDTEAGTNPKLPVLVFIHGGGFSSGRETIYLAQRILEEDLIFVTLQYRLGPLGFLCLQIEDAPGNAALYDLMTALQWVNQNIAAFGGDPDRVTISGQSAGSVCTTALFISPITAGLFHGIIAESGSVLTTWGVDSNPVEHGVEFASHIGCTEGYGRNLTAITECIRGKTAQEIMSGYDSFESDQQKRGQIGFGATTPCVQTVAPPAEYGFDRILPEDPHRVLKYGRYNPVPAMLGATRTEGSYIAGVIDTGYINPNNVADNATFLTYDFGDVLMGLLDIDDPSHAITFSLISSYMNLDTLGNLTAMMPGFVDLMGAFFMKAPCYQTAMYNSQFKDTFWYSFDYSGSHSLFSEYFGSAVVELIPHDVTHGDELIYLYLPNFAFPLNDTEKILSRQMIKMWYNFVAYSNPTPSGVDNGDVTLPTWPSLYKYTPQYMSIAGPDELLVKENYQLSWYNEQDEYDEAAREDEIAELKPIGKEDLVEKCSEMEGTDGSDSDDDMSAYEIATIVLAVILVIVIVALIILLMKFKALKRVLQSHLNATVHPEKVIVN